MAMVARANRESSGIGGHIASFASAATLYDVGFNHFFRAANDAFGGDLVYYQSHPLMAIYQARFMRYLADRGIVNTEGRKVWAFLGDGEMDEPESRGALSIAAREGLDNLISVINCNLQRLGGPVPMETRSEGRCRTQALRHRRVKDSRTAAAALDLTARSCASVVASPIGRQRVPQSALQQLAAHHEYRD
jgi:pyruvate dehydrogenase complex dehydrogenase (E1) component